MEALDPKLRQALMDLPGGFNEAQKENARRFKSMEDKIDELPQKIFDCKIKVKNGGEKEISFKDAVTQNWENTAKLDKEIREGSILVPIRDEENKDQYMRLADILTKLYRRPSMWFSKSASASDKVVKIGKFVFGLGMVMYIIFSFFNRG